LEIAHQHQAGKNALDRENEALRQKLADVSNINNHENDDRGTTPAHRSKRQRTRPPSTPAGSDDDEDSTGQVDSEEQFVNNAGHKFCITYALWVHKSADIFKVKFDDTYDATERFENETNKIQGQLQEIIGLLEERLSQETILCQKWVCREVRGFYFI
jgi:hypothetical protein